MESQRNIQICIVAQNIDDCILDTLHARLKERVAPNVDLICAQAPDHMQVFESSADGKYKCVKKRRVLRDAPQAAGKNDILVRFPYFYTHRIANALIVAIDTSVFAGHVTADDEMQKHHGISGDDLESRLALVDAASAWITRSIRTEGPGCSHIVILGKHPIVCVSLHKRVTAPMTHHKELLTSINMGVDALEWHGGANVAYVCSESPFGFQASVLRQGYMGHSRHPVAHIAMGNKPNTSFSLKKDNYKGIITNDHDLSVQIEAIADAGGYCELNLGDDGAVLCDYHNACSFEKYTQTIKMFGNMQ